MRGILFRSGIALTLLGACVLTLLPAGLLPQKAGPCGQKLCLCLKSKQVAAPHESCSDAKCATKAAEARWMLVAGEHLSAHHDQVTFYVVFQPFLTPQGASVVNAASELEHSTYAETAFCYADPPQHFVAPPPKSSFLL